MARMIRQGADVVVASPYHPDGAVLNVPWYRVFLSKNLSRLYRIVLGSDLYTYTSLFRLYRIAVIRAVAFEANGFVSMAEILVAALLKGYRVVEFPTRLAVREYGESKAAIARLMRDHVRLLSHLIRRRVRVVAERPTGVTVTRDPGNGKA
jgi:dolichol-phosphate mannosyltransferase